MLLIGLAFVQSSGLITADTKFDLVENPSGFLGRALHLWDPQSALGQVQNQAYGYLWPMGPFHLLGIEIGLPAWVVQRFWLALVLCVAFVGAAKVAKALGMRSDLVIVVVGLAYALSPRMLTTLGPISIEAWPSAVAPWVLLPLIHGSSRGSARSAACLSGLAVAMVGGVNAAATFSVLPLGVVWLLTRGRGPRRRTLMLWWPAFVLLGTLWWLIPLFLLGAYSPPFLDFIETTTVTTFPTTIFDALRGTSNWVPYISTDSRAGNDLIIQGYLALNSAVVLLLGFVGLIDRRSSHRLFLVLSLILGLVMVTAGHYGSVQGYFVGPVRDLLDGPLAPLRNVHKFDPVLRLPLVLGMGLALERVVRGLSAVRPGLSEAREPGNDPADDVRGDRVRAAAERINRVSVLAVTLLVVAGSAVPAFAGRIAPASPVLEVPDYWSQAASWLGKNSGPAEASLLAPGSAFATYAWGSPQDEPLQFEASSRWAVRNQIPLAPPGGIRMLSEIEQRFAQGRGSSGLTRVLSRAGVRYLVVRNDLRRSDDVPDSVLVHQALRDSPGITRVRSFGPEVGGEPSLVDDGRRVVVNGGWQARYRAIEVYRVPGSSADTRTSSPAVVAAGPEDVLDLLDLGVVGDAGVVMAADVPGERLSGVLSGAPLVLTDGLRARENFFPRLHDGTSAALTPGDVRRSGNPTRDYHSDDQRGWATTVRLEGARSIAASSSRSDSDATGGSRRGDLPYAAVDGSPQSQWVSDPADGAQSWWGIRFSSPRPVTKVRLTGGADAEEDQRVRVLTQGHRSAIVPLGPGESAEVPLPLTGTGWLRVEDAAGEAGGQVALADVKVPGLDVVRRLALPVLPKSWGDPDSIVLRADLDARSGCAALDEDVRCAPDKERPSEEQVGSARQITLSSAAAYEPTMRATARAGPSLEQVILRDQPVNVSASSRAVPDVRGSAVAAIDGDPGTSWVASPDDPRPTLALSWLRERRLSEITLASSPDVAGRGPQRVTLTWPGGEQQVELDSQGRGTFPAFRAKELQVRVDQAETVRDLDFAAQGTTPGVAVAEVRLNGVPQLPVTLSTRPADLGCASGPTVEVNGLRYETSVTATARQLFDGASLPAVVCPPTSRRPKASRTSAPTAVPLSLRTGSNDVTVRDSETFTFESMVLNRPGAPTIPSDAARVDVDDRQPASLRIGPTPGGALVTLAQNSNPGWTADQGSKRLSPMLVDGWKQAWVTRGTQATQARFAPDGVYRLGLLVGGLALVVLLGLAVALKRRTDRAKESAPLAAGSVPGWALVLLALAASVLVAGTSGLVVVAITLVAAGLLQRRIPAAAPWLLSLPCLVVAIGYFAMPWGSADGWAGNSVWLGHVMLVPVAAAVLAAAPGRLTFFRRITGISTNR